MKIFILDICHVLNPYLLLEQLERALLGLVAGLDEILQRLLAQRVLLLADNAPLARLHQILLLQATGRVLGRSVIHLRLAADCNHVCHFYLY